MRQAKETFYDLIVGIVIFTVIAGVIGFIVVKDRLPFVLGLLYGSLLSLGLAYHMFQGIDKTLDFSAPDAEKYARKMSVIRMGIMAVAVAIVILLPHIFSIAGAIPGMLALKFAAYLQPLIHSKFTSKIYKKGE